MSIRQEDLVAINEQIWASMLGIVLSMDQSGDAGGREIGACVQLVGAWHGAVLVECSLALARRAAHRLLGRESDSVSLEEVRDTVGELANMAAGGVKALLPQPMHISLPAVADGRDYDLTIRRGKVVLQCPFEAEGERLLVSLVEQDPAWGTNRPLTNRVQ